LRRARQKAGHGMVVFDDQPTDPGRSSAISMLRHRSAGAAEPQGPPDAGEPIRSIMLFRSAKAEHGIARSPLDCSAVTAAEATAKGAMGDGDQLGTPHHGNAEPDDRPLARADFAVSYPVAPMCAKTLAGWAAPQRWLPTRRPLPWLADPSEPWATDGAAVLKPAAHESKQHSWCPVLPG